MGTGPILYELTSLKAEVKRQFLEVLDGPGFRKPNRAASKTPKKIFCRAWTWGETGSFSGCRTRKTVLRTKNGNFFVCTLTKVQAV
jgi:hypothetical protein